MRVALTGANGFVGRQTALRLIDGGHEVRGLVRRATDVTAGAWKVMEVGEVDGYTEWHTALADVDVVIHLAARTHAVTERGGGDLRHYRPVNVAGTKRLAEAAAAAGVRRLVFISSVKVNGERTLSEPFVARDRPTPRDAYGISKWEAEQALAEIAERKGLEAVVIRPPLVYGPGARGNFARLCVAVRRGFVLPFGAIQNRRSLVGLDNLVDLIALCVHHPAAAGQTFLVSDGEDVSTPDLVRRLARAMGVRARMIPVPPSVIQLGGLLVGRGAEVGRLVGSLQVDIEHTRDLLSWNPPVTVDEGLRRAVADV